MHKAFVQIPRDPVSLMTVAAQGLYKLGYEVIRFPLEDADKLDVTQDTLVCGFIEVVRGAVQRLTGSKPDVINYPAPLLRWAGRNIWMSTIGEIRNDPDRWPVFIKPADDLKSFSGRVIRGVKDLRVTAGIPNETPVFCSDPINLMSEYRCFVVRGEVVGCRHYKGSPLVFPIGRRIQQMVDAWKEAPAAYCLDVGCADFYPRVNETVLVEVNDAYSAGDYGLDPLIYARFIEARWCEMTGASPIP